MSTKMAFLPWACIAVTALASVSMASTFDNLRAGELTPIIPVDALLTEGVPPTTMVTMAAMGLLSGDEIDALSFGNDAGIELDRHRIVFSVDAAAAGDVGSGVAFEVLTGTAPSVPGPGPNPAEASGDLFIQSGQLAACSNILAPAGSGYLLGVVNTDGDEANGEWRSPNVAMAADDLDAFDYSDADGTDSIPSGVYFSLAPGSPSLAALGFTAGDILFSSVTGAAPIIATLAGVGPATDVELGIAGEDLDALNLVGDNTGVIEVGVVHTWTGCANMVVSTHLVQYSIAAVAAFAPGDVLVRTAASTAMIHTGFASLGLLSGDNLNALEVVVPPVPTVSEWGVAVMALLVLLVGTIVVRRQRKVAVA